MISDPDDQIRRMNDRHAKRKQPEPSEVERLAQDSLRAAVVAMLLDREGKTEFDVAILDLVEYSDRHITYSTYEDEFATVPERKMRLKITVTQA